jgi:hypothetical protein
MKTIAPRAAVKKAFTTTSKALLALMIAFAEYSWSAGNSSSPWPDYRRAEKSTVLLLSQGVSEAEAVEKAKTSADDKVLKVEKIIVDGRRMYKIKLLTAGGRVRTLMVAADQ